GPEVSFQAASPVLEAFGSYVVHLGPVGSGLKMKALNQALLIANFTSAALALDTGGKLGLDRATAESVLRSATGDSVALDLLGDRILTDPQFADLTDKIIGKDLDVFEAACRSVGVDPGELGSIAAHAQRSISNLLALARC